MRFTLTNAMYGGKSRPVLHVELTRRNLLTLIAKLEIEDSKRTLEKFEEQSHNAVVLVTSVEDEAHYTIREPGPVGRATEEKIVKVEADLCLNSRAYLAPGRPEES